MIKVTRTKVNFFMQYSKTFYKSPLSALPISAPQEKLPYPFLNLTKTEQKVTLVPYGLTINVEGQKAIFA